MLVKTCHLYFTNISRSFKDQGAIVFRDAERHQLRCSMILAKLIYLSTEMARTKGNKL